jgi:hypothetical protein
MRGLKYKSFSNNYTEIMSWVNKKFKNDTVVFSLKDINQGLTLLYNSVLENSINTISNPSFCNTIISQKSENIAFFALFDIDPFNNLVYMNGY